MEEDIKWAEKAIYGVTAYGSYSHIFNDKEVKAIENLISENTELKLTDNEKQVLEAYRNIVKEFGEDIGWVICNPKQMYSSWFVPKSKIKEKIEELNIRIDYLDKELTEAYIVREKLGTETDIDTNEQYIYNMEQERSIRHTQKRVLQELLD